MNAKNKLFYGDNLEIMREHIEDESVDLCYIDPPFNSKRNYNQIYNSVGKEDRAQSQAFIDTWSWNESAEIGLNEILYGRSDLYTSQTIALIHGFCGILGKSDMLAYLISMTQRINEIHRILKSSGSFYLHCDSTMSHYLKLVLDSVFCARDGDFRNEIIWCYKERELSKKCYNKKHDTIFFYTKSEDCVFNYKDILEPYSEITLKKFKYTDNTGRNFRIREKNSESHSVNLEEEAKNPELYYRDYLDKHGGGVLPRDWIIIPILNQASKERLGYPTQKPEKLLERIIKASSNEGDIVFDAYCGCGTTVAVAERLKRRWIGIDITFQSISLIVKRLEDTYGKEVLKNIEFMGIPQDIESAEALAHKKDDRLRKEFEKWAILTYSNNRAIINEKRGKDFGIDGIAYAFGKSKHKILFSVKSGHVSSSMIRDFRGTIDRENALGGVFITLENPTKDMREEAVKAGVIEQDFSANVINKIQIITVQEILDGERLNFSLGIVVKSAKRLEISQGDQLKFA